MDNMSETQEGDELAPHIRNFFQAFGNPESHKKLSLASEPVSLTRPFEAERGKRAPEPAGDPFGGPFGTNVTPPVYGARMGESSLMGSALAATFDNSSPVPYHNVANRSDSGFGYGQPRQHVPHEHGQSRFWFGGDSQQHPSARQQGTLETLRMSNSHSDIPRVMSNNGPWESSSVASFESEPPRRPSDGTRGPATAEQLDDYLEKMLRHTSVMSMPPNLPPNPANGSMRHPPPRPYNPKMAQHPGPPFPRGGGGLLPTPNMPPQPMKGFPPMRGHMPQYPPYGQHQHHPYNQAPSDQGYQHERRDRIERQDRMPDLYRGVDERAGRHGPRDDPLDDEDRAKRAPKPLPELSPIRRLEIDAQVQDILSKLEPTEAELRQRQALLQTVDALVKREWPGAYVKLYGSSGNQFGLRGADIDMCLFVELKEDESSGSVITRLGELLEAEGNRDVLPLPDTRVPIVKFKECETGLPVDICLNNYLALNNTEFLATYGNVDSRLVLLSRFVKYWAKRRRINEPYLGTLSSYAYVLLCIYYLQSRPLPVLPNLQTMPPPGQSTCPSVMVNDYDCYYFKDVQAVHDMGYGPNARNHESLAELVVGFFHYFAYNFDYHENVISVRLGHIISKEKKEWTLKHNTRHNRYWLCIEDPFETTHNLGRVADRNTLYDIRGEFMRAYRVFNNGGTVDELCEQYIPPPDEGGRREARDHRDPRAKSPRTKRDAPKGATPISPMPEARVRTTSGDSDGPKSPKMRPRSLSSSNRGEDPLATAMASLEVGSPEPVPRPRQHNPINRKPGQHSSHRQYRDPSAKAYQKTF